MSIRSAIALLLIRGLCCHWAYAGCLGEWRFLAADAERARPSLSVENRGDLDAKLDDLVFHHLKAPAALSADALRSYQELTQLLRSASETKDPDSITGRRRWAMYLKELKHFLDLNGIRWESVFIDGQDGLEIVPGHNGRALNELAYLVKARFGARTLYLPRTLQKLGTLAYIEGWNHGARVLGVSTLAMLGLGPRDYEEHEAIHLRSLELADLGHESLFHGSLQKKKRERPGSYEDFLGLDELYGYAADTARQQGAAVSERRIGALVAERVRKAAAQAKKQLMAGGLPPFEAKTAPSGKQIPAFTFDLGEEKLVLDVARASVREKYDAWSNSIRDYEAVGGPIIQHIWEKNLVSQVDPAVARELDLALENGDFQKVYRWMTIDFENANSNRPQVFLKFQKWKSDGSADGPVQSLEINGDAAQKLIVAARAAAMRQYEFNTEALAALRERLDVLERVAGDSLGDFKAIQAAANDPERLRQLQQQPYRRMTPYFDWK